VLVMVARESADCNENERIDKTMVKKLALLNRREKLESLVNEKFGLHKKA